MSDRSRVVPDGKKVISMSLYGNIKSYTYGAIRNAQLLPVVFPGWTLRVYVAVPESPLAVPYQIIQTLVRLNVDVREINASSTNIPPGMWRLLVAVDPDIEFFLIRDADGRLSEREYDMTVRLIERDEPFLCVRDHVTHCNCTVPRGLWGGKSEWFQAPHLKKSFPNLLDDSELTEKYFLEKALEKRFNRDQCENLVECGGAHKKNYELSSETYAYIGTLYDEFGEFKQPYNRCV